MKKILPTLVVIALTIVYSSQYSNPVQDFRDSPDPGVIHDGNYFYAATTMGWDGHYFPIWKSSDLFSWTQ